MSRSVVSVLAMVAVLLGTGCASGASAPTAPKKNATLDQGAANSGGTGQLSALAQLSASGEGVYEVRDRQVQNLTAERDSYVQQLVTLQYTADQLFSSNVQVQQAGVQAITDKTPLSAGVGSVVALGGGAAVALMTNDWTNIISPLATSATLISGSVDGTSSQSKGQASAKASSAQVQQQQQIAAAQIANLQSKIDALNAQIAQLNAQKLPQN